MLVRACLNSRRAAVSLPARFPARHASEASTSKKKDPPSPNDEILQMLRRNMEEEDNSPERNPFKIRAFEGAIKTIRQLDYAITSANDVKGLKGIGTRIAQRIEDHLQAHPPSAADVSAAPRKKPDLIHASIIELLQTVSGVGSVKAKQLVDAGCSSVQDMRNEPYFSKLTSAQKLGMKYYDHLKKDVSREEAEAIAAFIRDHIDPAYELHIAGSYRRGASTSHDVDILLFHYSLTSFPPPQGPPSVLRRERVGPSTSFKSKSITKEAKENSLLVNEVVRPLERAGLISDTLACGPQKWQGVVRVPARAAPGSQAEWEPSAQRTKDIESEKGEYRRVDINLIPPSVKGAALLATTGDVEFMKHTRGRAMRMGLQLNEFGLWRWASKDDDNGADLEGADAEDDADGVWVHVRGDTEEGILAEIGLPYVLPEKRNFRFLKPGQRGKAE